MKVKWASQALSNSVYLAIEAFIAVNVLPPQAISTAEFVEQMNHLFDSLNSSCVNIMERKMRCAISYSTDHIEILNSSFRSLENLFGIIRQQNGCNQNLNTFQCTAGLRHIIVGKLFELSDGSNCEAEKAVLLTELKNLRLDQGGAAVADASSSKVSDIEGTEEPADILESSIVCYISG
ncbi:uncharacterized protein LOC142775116 [Rhipicephalus microplus]|uniref:uncharacterized protein LOC142775116 n=1 Tax=Rhipicephalus microplus TaxID=6941 RepID=UPI003F6D38EE